MADFTYVPSRGFTTETSPRVLTAAFGDGYIQKIGDGINTLVQSWNLQFNSNSITDITAIQSFFETKAGVISFTWRPPTESTDISVICPKWSKTYESEFSASISATFERWYG